jgi:hypothetical protein
MSGPNLRQRRVETDSKPKSGGVDFDDSKKVHLLSFLHLTSQFMSFKK